MRYTPLLVVALVGCAQSVGFPEPTPTDSNDAAAPPPVEAGPPTRVGTYFGDYVVSSGGGGTMLLVVKDDGFVTLTPHDVNATGTGTVDEAGNVKVTTEYDLFAQSTLSFTGKLVLEGTSWKASGSVIPQSISNQNGTWAATLK